MFFDVSLKIVGFTKHLVTEVTGILGIIIDMDVLLMCTKRCFAAKHLSTLVTRERVLLPMFNVQVFIQFSRVTEYGITLSTGNLWVLLLSLVTLQSMLIFQQCWALVTL